MSIIFGVRRPEGMAVHEHELQRLAIPTKRFAPDGTYLMANRNIGMGFQPYHTHERSNLETQPAQDEFGNMLVFDGRLDNWRDLANELRIDRPNPSDSEIALLAFLRWKSECFSRFLGDWSTAIWSAADHSIHLARDHAGTRSLYFSILGDTLYWSTHLETFLTGDRIFQIDEEYVAFYLGARSVGDRTPYRDIRAVSPAHYLVIQDGDTKEHAHWQWMVKETIHYRSDGEYEEHFYSHLQRSVERRTGPGAPIAAQLSGGMDSSSIVCMSDQTRKQQGVAPPNLIDTISYYNDLEPNWNERPFFEAVESKRGKRGIHLNTSGIEQRFEPPASAYLLPGRDSTSLIKERLTEKHLQKGGHRVILSGIGGDELLGGVPDPLPELADYLVSAKLHTLLSRGLQWCLIDQTSLIQLLLRTAKYTTTLYPWPQRNLEPTPPWIATHLQQANRNFRIRQAKYTRTLGLRPSAIDNGLTWWTILETLPHLLPSTGERYEYRYPLLDRELVDFLLRVPNEQLVRPGRRRSLMRRALREIVPGEVLERRRKAFVFRGPLASIREHKDKLLALTANSYLRELGLIDEKTLHSFIEQGGWESAPQWRLPMIKAISLELWMRSRFDDSSTPTLLRPVTNGATEIHAREFTTDSQRVEI